MKYYINDFTKNITSLNRFTKKSIAIITDFSLCILCTWLAYCLRLEEMVLLDDLNINTIILSIFLAIPLFWIFGLYRTIFRFTSLSIIFTIFFSLFIYGLLYFLIIGIYGVNGTPRSIGLIQPLLLFFAVISSRLFVKYLLSFNKNPKDRSLKKKKVLIYGAGNAGRQLVIALENSLDFEVIGFLDDNVQLQKQILLGQNIYSVSSLGDLIKMKDVSMIFLALPSIGRNKRNQIIEKLNKHKLIVKTLPSVEDVVGGRVSISDIKDLNIDDLLNREQVIPNSDLLSKNIKFKTVLVTGAGGSIGSELCRQIVKQKPNKLLLLELNEFSLYKIYEELRNYNKNLKIVSLIANIQDQKKLEQIFKTFQVETVYHAAAYKHVPLVEENICEGVKNNVFGSLAVCKAAIKQNVSNLVLISSDKAVRPTNIMGASKRLAELSMQAVHKHYKDNKTNFSIVRFGNVLESSGSVIPKFKKQIKEGGPVTLTHNDVTRYFMTVTEAAQLVIQAGALGKDAEIFILDMGESVKIKDLIYKMIKLSGLTIRNDNYLEGDIEVKVIGLRPGEKLYEELLIGDNPEKTSHEKIKKTNDSFIPLDQIKIHLHNLEELINNEEPEKVKKSLDKILKLYKSNTKIVDHIYNEKSSNNNNKIKSLEEQIDNVVEL